MNDNDRQAIYLLLIERVYSILELLIRGAVYCVIAYCIYLSIDALAGGKTWVSITLRDVDYGIPWIVAVIATLYGLFERKFRLRKVASMQRHIKQLELQLDNNRTSSNLSPDGQTNPEDKL